MTYMFDAPFPPLWFDGGFQISLRLAQQISGDCHAVIRNPGAHFTKWSSSEMLTILGQFIDERTWYLYTTSP